MAPAIRSCRSGVSLLLLLALVALLPSSRLLGQAPTPAVTPAASAAPTSDADREAFLVRARIVRVRSAGKGVTNTLRATLSDGAITHEASIQTVDEAKQVFQSNQGTELNFKDSWRYNIAAYRLDRRLALGMIPVTVERAHQAKPGSFTWWVDDVLMDEGERYKSKRAVPDTDDWNQQMWITRLFDQLIANVDRNLGNLLIDTRWNVWMIDHSRAFRLNESLRSPGNLSKVDRGLLARLREMTEADVKRVTDDYLLHAEIKALLARRDRIVEHYDKVGMTMVFDRRPR